MTMLLNASLVRLKCLHMAKEKGVSHITFSKQANCKEGQHHALFQPGERGCTTTSIIGETTPSLKLAAHTPSSPFLSHSKAVSSAIIGSVIASVSLFQFASAVNSSVARSSWTRQSVLYNPKPGSLTSFPSQNCRFAEKVYINT